MGPNGTVWGAVGNLASSGWLRGNLHWPLAPSCSFGTFPPKSGLWEPQRVAKIPLLCCLERGIQSVRVGLCLPRRATRNAALAPGVSQVRTQPPAPGLPPLEGAHLPSRPDSLVWMEPLQDVSGLASAGGDGPLEGAILPAVFSASSLVLPPPHQVSGGRCA